MTRAKKQVLRSFALILALLCAFLGSCSTATTTVTPNHGDVCTFTDATGTTVTLEKKPQKVAVLFSSFAEIWQLSGGEVSITVGEAVERGFADSSTILVDSGAGHSLIDTEALVEAAPDLVIGTADYAGQVEAVEFCRGIGIPSALFRVETFDDYLSVLSVFCEINDTPDNYETYGSAVKNQVDEAKRTASELLLGAESAPSILFLRAGSSDRSTKAKTAEDNFVCAMLSELGCENIADKNGSITGELSLEAILEEDPDYLFISTMGNEEAAIEHVTNMLSKEGWRELDCVKSASYCFLPRDLFHYKPNAKWGEAYEYLISILYPEASDN